jgi:hypothetical protein
MAFPAGAEYGVQMEDGLRVASKVLSIVAFLLGSPLYVQKQLNVPKNTSRVELPSRSQEAPPSAE